VSCHRNYLRPPRHKTNSSGVTLSRVLSLIAITGGLICLTSPYCHAGRVQGDPLGVFSGNDNETDLTEVLGLSVKELTRIDFPVESHDGMWISNLILNDDDEPIGGHWDYIDPMGTRVVDIFVVKAGPMYAAYEYTDENTMNMRNMGQWTTNDIFAKGMSHITGYMIVPEPSAMLLVSTSLLSFICVSRLRRLDEPIGITP